MLQIVIHGEDQFVVRLTDAAQKGVVLTKVTHQVDADDARAGGTQLCNHAPAFISAIIVNEQDFIIGA